MPLSLVHRVPSTARSLFTLDEDEHLIPASPSFDRKIGAYTLTEHIGAGASGSNVFAAWLAASPSELVAVKVLEVGLLEDHPTACALPRFLREADITCSLGPHPNLVRGLESGERDGHRYLAMNLLRGQTVGALMQQRGRLEWREATLIARDVARGLAHLAACRVVHRDIKPENIMVCGQGEAASAVLIDFGLARRTDGQDDEEDGGGEVSLALTLTLTLTLNLTPTLTLTLTLAFPLPKVGIFPTTEISGGHTFFVQNY